MWRQYTNQIRLNIVSRAISPALNSAGQTHRTQVSPFGKLARPSKGGEAHSCAVRDRQGYVKVSNVRCQGAKKIRGLHARNFLGALGTRARLAATTTVPSARPLARRGQWRPCWCGVQRLTVSKLAFSARRAGEPRRRAYACPRDSVFLGIACHVTPRLRSGLNGDWLGPAISART